MKSQFVDVMFKLGYHLDEQEGKKLTYSKKKYTHRLVLVIDLERNYIDAILVPGGILCCERDIKRVTEAFDILQVDAKMIKKLSGGKLTIL